MERFKVKVVKPSNRRASSGGKEDSFIPEMDRFNGQTIEVVKMKYEGWFQGERFNWHCSWLEFFSLVLVEDDVPIDENDY